MTKTKTEARRELAKVYLHDAGYAGQSWCSRTQAALDAAYLLALVLLGEQKADIYEHPAPGALVAVAEKLGWSAASVEPAIFEIEHHYDFDHQTQWYGPNGEARTGVEIRDSSRFAELMELALRLQAADEAATNSESANGS